MASLQNTFHYEGDSTTAPIESVLLFFDIPTYKFETVLRDGKPFPERVHLGTHTLQVHRALNSAGYFAPFASELLIGATDLSVKNFHAYYAAINFERDDARLAWREVRREHFQIGHSQPSMISSSRVVF